MFCSTVRAIAAYGSRSSSTPTERPFASGITGCSTRMVVAEPSCPWEIEATGRPSIADRKDLDAVSYRAPILPSSAKTTRPEKSTSRSCTTEPWTIARSVADQRAVRCLPLSWSCGLAPLRAGPTAICSMTSDWARPCSSAWRSPSCRYP